MAKPKCFDAIAKESKGLYKDDEIQEILDKLISQRNNALDSGLDTIKELKSIGNDIFKDKNIDSRLQQLRSKLNIVKRNNIILGYNKDFYKRKNGLNDWWKAFLTGTPYRKGSIELGQRTLSLSIEGSFMKEIKENGLEDIFNSTDHDLNILKLLGNEEIKDKSSIPYDKFKKYSELINKYRNFIESKYNDNAIFIKHLEGWMTKNYHNKAEMMKTHDSFKERQKIRISVDGNVEKLFDIAYKRWKKITLPLLNHEKTFKYTSNGKETQLRTESEIDKFLKESYNTLTDNFSPTKTPGKISNRVTSKRILHFNDAESTLKYIQKLGMKNLRNTIMREFKEAARNIPILELLGDEPKKMMSDLITHFSEDDKYKFRFNKSKVLHDALRRLSIIDGSLHSPPSMISSIGGNIRSFINLKMYPGILISAIMDTTTVTRETSLATGDGYLKSSGLVVKNLFDSIKTSEDKKKICSLLLAHNQAHSGAMMRWFTNEEMTGEAVANLQRLGYKYGGAQWWDYTNTSGVAAIWSKMLADNRNTLFENMSKDHQKILTSYNIRPKEWDLFRSTPLREADGNYYLTPDGFRYVDDDKIKAYIKDDLNMQRVSKTLIEKTKDELERKFGMFFVDRMDYAIMHPDSSVRDFWTFGIDPSTTAGQYMWELARCIGQFKQYVSSIIQRPIKEIIYGNDAENLRDAFLNPQTHMDYIHLAKFIAAGTLFGYVSNSARAVALNGTTPPSPLDLSTWLEAADEGGGLQPLTNVLFHKQFGSWLMGPDGRLLNDGRNIFFSKNKTRAVGTFLNKTARSFWPPILRAVMGALVHNQIQESLTPGYKKRQLSMLKQYDQQNLFN